MRVPPGRAEQRVDRGDGGRRVVPEPEAVLAKVWALSVTANGATPAVLLGEMHVTRTRVAAPAACQSAPTVASTTESPKRHRRCGTSRSQSHAAARACRSRWARRRLEALKGGLGSHRHRSALAVKSCAFVLAPRWVEISSSAEARSTTPRPREERVGGQRVLGHPRVAQHREVGARLRIDARRAAVHPLQAVEVVPETLEPLRRRGGRVAHELPIGATRGADRVAAKAAAKEVDGKSRWQPRERQRDGGRAAQRAAARREGGDRDGRIVVESFARVGDGAPEGHKLLAVERDPQLDGPGRLRRRRRARDALPIGVGRRGAPPRRQSGSGTDPPARPSGGAVERAARRRLRERAQLEESRATRRRLVRENAAGGAKVLSVEGEVDALAAAAPPPSPLQSGVAQSTTPGAWYVAAVTLWHTQSVASAQSHTPSGTCSQSRTRRQRPQRSGGVARHQAREAGAAQCDKRATAERAGRRRERRDNRGA